MSQLTAEGKAKAQADYEEGMARIDAAVAVCPHCKSAKTWAVKKIEKKNLVGEKREAALRRVADVNCQKHRSAYRLN